MSGISIPNTPLKRPQNVLEVPQLKTLPNVFDCEENVENGNVGETTTNTQLNNISTCVSNNNKSPETTVKDFANNIFDIDTNDLILVDNATSNVIKLENFKRVDVFSNMDNHFNTSTNSLNSENLSSPMQTSTDVYLDSEVLSTDMASNDSHSPKNLQTQNDQPAFDYKDRVLDIDLIKYFVKQPQLYTSNESLSNAKTDQSLLNSGGSCDSSPLHKLNRDYKKQKKHKKKYFGVKTLQSIFNKHDGYSDVSTTASENGDEVSHHEPKRVEEKTQPASTTNKDHPLYPETSPQFEENIHTLLSDIFLKNFSPGLEQACSNVSLTKSIGSKKYFSLHGQNLRVGKALTLCPNEQYTDIVENEQRKEKLLARYVYNANSINADGVGDPDFGTPV